MDMRKYTTWSRVALATVATLAFLPSAAAAPLPDSGGRDELLARAENGDTPQRRRRHRRSGGFEGAHGAPEIDPGLLAGGLALLVGGTLVLLGQRRQRLTEPD